VTDHGKDKAAEDRAEPDEDAMPAWPPPDGLDYVPIRLWRTSDGFVVVYALDRDDQDEQLRLFTPDVDDESDGTGPAASDIRSSNRPDNVLDEVKKVAA